MSDLHSPVKQPAKAQDASFAENESAMPSLMPPAFQLMASGAGGGGDPKKKAPAPSNDHPVGPEAYGNAKSKPIPDAIISQIENEITGIEHLEIAADLVLVHSPCYSAEIYTLISMVNDGSMDLQEGKKQIMDRIVYLLTNEFKDAEGQPNDWAKSNLQGTTVDNADNMGADWYRHGENGPKYLALTDWNDQTKPEQGGNQYEIFRLNPQGEAGEGPGTPFFQPFGNPMTSLDTQGQNTEGNKAKNTGTPIDITWLQRILQMLTGGDRKKTLRKKGWEDRNKRKTFLEGLETDEKAAEDSNRKEALREMEVEEEKGLNTKVEYRRISEETGEQLGTTTAPNVNYLLDLVRDYPNDIWEVPNVYKRDPSKVAYTEEEVLGRIATEKRKHR